MNIHNLMDELADNKMINHTKENEDENQSKKR